MAVMDKESLMLLEKKPRTLISRRLITSCRYPVIIKKQFLNDENFSY